MLNDFELITHKFPENKDIVIIPISDVHLGAAEHMAAEWKHFCDSVLAEDNIFLSLGGDLLNNATRSSVSNIFEETLRPRDQKRIMAEMLTPLSERILCAVSGNHERRSGKDADDDPTYDIMCKLDLEHLYRENIAFVKIQIGDPGGNGAKNPTYVLTVTHGAGTGRQNERFGYTLDGVDLLVVGHTHRPYVSQPGKIKVDPFNNKVSVKPFKVVSSTSWLNYGGYAAQKMLLPTTHAAQKITLAGSKKEIIVSM